MGLYKHYKVISNSSMFWLEDEINSMMQDGWIPAGGMYKHNADFFQTMWVPPTVPELDKKIKAAFESEPKK